MQEGAVAFRSPGLGARVVARSSSWVAVRGGGGGAPQGGRGAPRERGGRGWGGRVVVRGQRRSPRPGAFLCARARASSAACCSKACAHRTSPQPGQPQPQAALRPPPSSVLSLLSAHQRQRPQNSTSAPGDAIWDSGFGVHIDVITSMANSQVFFLSPRYPRPPGAPPW
jgi:hypothetical protein